MRKLIAIVMMVFAVAMIGCSDKKQQYIDDLHKFCYSADTLATINSLIVIDSRSTKEEPSFFNKDYYTKSIRLNATIDSLYLLLLESPNNFQSSVNDIKGIYNSLKKSEDLVRAVYDNDYRWRYDMWSKNTDSADIYRDRITNSLYSLKTNIPQAFLENGD